MSLLRRAVAPLLALGLVACRADVIDLPPDQALRASDLLVRQGIAARSTPRGPHRRLSVPRADSHAAEALLSAAGFPRPADTPPDRLLVSPTEARLRAAETERARLRAALRGLPDVLDARVARTGEHDLAVLTVLPDARTDVAAVQALLGPTARIRLEVFQPPTRPTGLRPSILLSSAVAALSALVLALLVRVRRLRRALGR